MDFVWIGALAALWAVVAAMVVGLTRLNAPKPLSGGERS